MFGSPISKLVLCEYDPAWPIEFEKEKRRITDAVSAFPIRVDHIGSTAIPGMLAKPIIDISLAIENSGVKNPVVEALKNIGYDFRGLNNERDPEHWYLTFTKDGIRYFQIHLTTRTSIDFAAHLKFCDVLRSHPELRAEYVRLKHEWAEKTNWAKMAYSLSKDDFVKKVLGYDADK
jgi:GrpB-like predicted nucleotidyltransferase (UPF0157 family)